MGPTAFEWIDRLCDAGQSWWQALPLGPTGYGNSPYQSLSSFAGNGLLISPDTLIADGLLAREIDDKRSYPSTSVDYGATIAFKRRLLDEIWQNFRVGMRSDLGIGYEKFCHEQAHWLKDYALFRALKEKYDNAPYLDWPPELIQRTPVALAQARGEMSKQVDKVQFAQFLVFQQAQRLKEYAHVKGIELIGDLPFFPSPDSSDVWAHPELFLLDDNYRPRFVAGVPPDYFSAEGQLWGNPVYNWDALRQTGFRFYIDRVLALLSYVDVIRLDHFRAFVSAWHVPAGSKTARTGQWTPGPGAEFFDVLQGELGSLPFIAEDLGLITAEVCALRERFRVPGTKVLQFAFDGSPDNSHLPENYSTNSVVYTGTHDNDTTRGWFEALPQGQKDNVWKYLKRPNGESSEIAWELIRLAWSSAAALAITPLQDLLNLGTEARMNFPGRVEENWNWCFTTEMMRDRAFGSLREITANCNRLRACATRLPGRTMEAAT
jgi:4-alpha-glucanotransferase